MVATILGSPQCRDHARPLPRSAEQDVLQLRRPRAFAGPSLEAITASWSRIQELGPFTADVWPYIAKEVNSTRRLLAQCCGVPAHRLALTENVTSGCVLPLWGLPFADGERLLIGD